MGDRATSEEFDQLREKLTMPTCAVICRVQLIEAPYLNEFVHWYITLGFDKIYFINTEPEHRKAIEELIAEDLRHFVLFLTIDKSIQNEPEHYLLNYIKANVEEDFVLNADSDELLYIDLQRFKNIKEFLNFYNKNFYIFTIVNVSCFSLFSYSMVDFLISSESKVFFNETFKALGRAEKLRSINWQVMNGGKTSTEVDARNEKCFFFHFVIRSTTHQLLKQYYQQMNNFKDKNSSLLREFLIADNVEEMDLSRYPFRLLTTIALKLIGAKNDAKNEIAPIIERIPRTPDKYKADPTVVGLHVSRLLQSCLSQTSFAENLSTEKLDSFLINNLLLDKKLDAGRLSRYSEELSASDKLRVALDKLFCILEAESKKGLDKDVNQ